MNKIDLTIDSIILDNVGITLGGAEHLRTLVKMELQNILERDGLPEDFRGGDIQSLEVQAMHLDGPQSDSRIASTLAMKTVQALRSIR